MTAKTKEILKQLTLTEKCELMAQCEGSFGRVRRLGLEGNVPQDNPRGGADYFRSGKGTPGDGDYHPVAFPSSAALGASWDTALAYETGELFAMECRANPNPVTWLFRPGVNMKRSPLCGRNFEYLSEDPVVAGELAGSYIQGLQSRDVAATLKHYICNNQEFERMTTNSVVSTRALHEVYGRAFEIAIKKGAPLSIMSSYNRVNGEWVNSNPQVMDLLRKEIGYTGVVVSDFAAIHHTKVAAHANGMDIELAPVECHSKELEAAVLAGEISETLLEEELGRVFDLCERLYATTPVAIDMDQYHEKARISAEKCTVLLKNDGLLPLEAAQKNLLVLGALAEDPSYMGGGSGHMNGYKIDSPLEEIRRFVPDAAYAQGYILEQGFPPVDHRDDSLVAEAAEMAKSSDTIVAFVGPGYCTESEGYDRVDLLLPESQRRLLDAVLSVNTKVVLVASCASVLDLGAYESKVQGILYAPLTGEAFGGAVANILFGAAEPGGRLSETWPVCLEHTPAYLNFCPENIDMENVLYGEDIFLGHRWYEARRLPVRYPLGYGLSYTSFAVSDVRVSTATATAAVAVTDTDAVTAAVTCTPADAVTVSCTITNTGARTGSQVLQLYVKPAASTVKRPEKELKAFAKVSLAPGESKTVRMTINKEAFRYYSERQGKWIVESGVYTLLLATDANTIVDEKEVLMTNGDTPFVYTKMTALVWYMANPRFYEILSANYPKEVENFFHQETFEWCVLCKPLPFYRFAEPLLGPALFTDKDITFIINQMNQ